MSKYILETKDLSFEYPDGTNALKNINLNIEQGKKIAFVGVNGSGKSTLFLNFNGVLRPTKGRIMYKGSEVKYTQRSLLELRKNVGIVFQDPDNQLFSASVYQEVSFGAMNLKLNNTEVRKRVDEALKAVEMYEYKDKAVHFLSYGQKKRISIADILVMNPEIIVFDEPTSGIDPKHSKEIIKIFDELIENGKTVILSTHDVEVAYSWADYIIVMKDGEIVKEGTPYEIFSDEALIEACYLEKPLILEIYENLRKSEKINPYAEIPRNKQELFEVINYKGKDFMND
jgi:cobalt/nickel transport system ATP-binding protein